MSGFEIASWIGLMLFGFAGSALFSGMETGCYSLNRVRLQVRRHRGDASAHRLDRLVTRPTVLLSTLLIGNNIMNQLGAASLTRLFEAGGMTVMQVVICSVVIVTPILFIFGETLPKDLFAAYADRLMYPLARVLNGARILLTVTGFVPLVTLFTGLVMRWVGVGDAPEALQARHRFGSLMKEGLGVGIISDEQSAITDRILKLSERCVRDEMVPWAEVTTLAPDTDIAELRELATQTSLTRFPECDTTGVIGMLNLFDVITQPPASCPPMSELMRPVQTLAPSMPVRAALTHLQQQEIALAIVADEAQTPLGIVTAKDLIEPITGDLRSW